MDSESVQGFGQTEMEVKVEVLNTETIKPSSPTPQELRTFKFSVFDQLNPAIYVSLLLYYPDRADTQQLKPSEKSRKLKSSLSEVLTHFYPLAGRIKDNFSIQCTDEGPEYIETQINCSLSDILKLPDAVLFKKFVPREASSTEASTGCLLVVQANFFKQGGLAIGICISHKIADGSTLSSFINAWAGLAVESPEVVLPEFGASSMFPPIDFLTTLPIVELARSNCVMRRYLLNASKITALKSRTATESLPNPTSVEAVSALIWKCAVTASRKDQNLMKTSVLGQAVDLRKRLNPPLPSSFIGNLTGFFPARIEEEETELELQTLVARLRKGKEAMRHYVEQLPGKHGPLLICQAAADYGALMMNDSIEFYGFASWCRFPIYEADFGWGKPTWVSIPSDEHKNFIKLIDAPGGDGIEAWVTLGEADMAIFENDEEFLEFAELNPNIPCLYEYHTIK